MWPSLETASRVSDVANVVLVCSLVVGVVATALIVWMGNVKEGYWDADRQRSRERVAGLESGVADANARAAEANRIAESERLARIKIEAGLASRHLTQEQHSKLVAALLASKERLPSVGVLLLGDKEAADFGREIATVFGEANIPVQLIGAGVMSPPPYGIQITDDANGTLAAAFNAAQIPSTVATIRMTLPGPRAGGPAVLVGLKPPPF
jgi:hypothetical protein